MALLLKVLFENYGYVIKDLADERTKDLFLIGSPIPIIFILSTYLYFVNDFGPKYMDKRKPFHLDKILIGYNLIQIILCLIIIAGLFPLIFTMNWKCSEIVYTYEYPHYLATRATHIYYLVKIFDLLDTVFFVLRKKQNQITFLHVYHHTGMVILTWMGVRYFNGGHSLILPFVNTIVHVVMYTYYLLTVWDEELKKNIWWKKHITQIQLFQFGLLLIWYLIPLFSSNCKYPKMLISLVIPQNFAMFALFGDFYYKTYIQKKSAKT